MTVDLVTIKINKHTGETISKEIKETKKVDKDEFYRPLVETLGDAFLKHYRKEA